MNKSIILITGLLLTSSLLSCNQPKNELVGVWKMANVIQSGQDVSAEHNPNNERMIEFKENGRFQTSGRPFGTNEGAYTYQKNVLFLDSDAGEEDDSYWKVEMIGDSMRWEGTGTAWAEDFVLIHLRVR